MSPLVSLNLATVKLACWLAYFKRSSNGLETASEVERRECINVPSCYAKQVLYVLCSNIQFTFIAVLVIASKFYGIHD